MPPGGSGRPKNNAGCAPCIHGTESVSGGFCKAAPASEVFLGGTCKTCMKRTKVLLCWNSFRALIKCDIKLVSKVLAKCVPLRVRLILCACIHEYVCICVSVWHTNVDDSAFVCTTRAHARAHTHTHTLTRTYTFTNTHTCTCMLTHIHTHIRTYKHTLAHTHTHTYTHTDAKHARTHVRRLLPNRRKMPTSARRPTRQRAKLCKRWV